MSVYMISFYPGDKRDDSTLALNQTLQEFLKRSTWSVNMKSLQENNLLCFLHFFVSISLPLLCTLPLGAWKHFRKWLLKEIPKNCWGKVEPAASVFLLGQEFYLLIELHSRDIAFQLRHKRCASLFLCHFSPPYSIYGCTLASGTLVRPSHGFHFFWSLNYIFYEDIFKLILKWIYRI